MRSIYMKKLFHRRCHNLFLSHMAICVLWCCWLPPTSAVFILSSPCLSRCFSRCFAEDTENEFRQFFFFFSFMSVCLQLVSVNASEHSLAFPTTLTHWRCKGSPMTTMLTVAEFYPFFHHRNNGRASACMHAMCEYVRLMCTLVKGNDAISFFWMWPSFNFGWSVERRASQYLFWGCLERVNCFAID